MSAPEPLTPRLTAEDVRVLRAVPSFALGYATTWKIADHLATSPVELETLVLTLRGLEHLNFVYSTSKTLAEAIDGRFRTSVQRWMLSREGADYLASLDAPKPAPTQEALG